MELLAWIQLLLSLFTSIFKEILLRKTKFLLYYKIIELSKFILIGLKIKNIMDILI